MRARFLIAACLLSFAPAAASATVFVIPLSEALGTYPCSPGCPHGPITFHLPGIPVLVNGASLHVLGTTEVGLSQCDDTPGSPPFPWPTQIEGIMTSGQFRYWDAFAPMPLVAGAFDWTAPFTTSTHGNPADWSFLSDGIGELEFLAGPAPSLLGCWHLTPPPRVTVTGAWILIDADIPVPASASSWGRVKAHYR